MPVKIRLRRQGRKGQPYYHIVAADSRSPRDGRYIERIGSYDPTRIPAAIDVDHATALKWLRNGAQPTDTARAILRYTGVNLKFALEKQGKDQETIDKIFGKWWDEKQSKIGSKIGDLENKKREDEKVRAAHEAEVREKVAAKVAAKNAPPVEETPEVAEEAEVEATSDAEATAEAEAPAAEEAGAEEAKAE